MNCNEERSQCKIDEQHLQLFLGAFSVLKYLIGIITRIHQGDSNSQDPPQPHPAQSLITCFLCGWFITGKIISYLRKK